jgi:hypothetical protein
MPSQNRNTSPSNNTYTSKKTGSPWDSFVEHPFGNLLATHRTRHIPRLSEKHKLINYFRYVDEILLIFDTNKTNIKSILTDFNTLHSNLKFTAEIEQNNTISFLDTTIHRAQDSIKVSIYRKPTFIDTIIPYISNHPPQHKYAAVRFLYNRLNAYQLHTDEYKQEENIIQIILHNNLFPIRPQKSSTHKHKHAATPPTPNQKWATFTYTGKETTHITNAFKHANIRIAFRTRNSILSHLTNHTYTHKDQYFSSGVYKPTRPECNKHT